jgi:hypothetical protein
MVSPPIGAWPATSIGAPAAAMPPIDVPALPEVPAVCVPPLLLVPPLLVPPLLFVPAVELVPPSPAAMEPPLPDEPPLELSSSPPQAHTPKPSANETVTSFKLVLMTEWVAAFADVL